MVQLSSKLNMDDESSGEDINEHEQINKRRRAYEHNM
jgi:hypothetical protein